MMRSAGTPSFSRNSQCLIPLPPPVWHKSGAPVSRQALAAARRRRMSRRDSAGPSLPLLIRPARFAPARGKAGVGVVAHALFDLVHEHARQRVFPDGQAPVVRRVEEFHVEAGAHDDHYAGVPGERRQELRRAPRANRLAIHQRSPAGLQKVGDLEAAPRVVGDVEDVRPGDQVVDDDHRVAVTVAKAHAARVDLVGDAARRFGKPLGVSMGFDPVVFDEWVGRGACWFAMGDEYSLAGQSAANLLKAARERIDIMRRKGATR